LHGQKLGDGAETLGYDEVVVTQDLLHALRWLFKHPWFLVAVVAILALGIGANTAIFSIADAVLLRPPPYQASERLVRIKEKAPKWELSVISAEDFRFWENRSDLFDRTVPYRRDIATLNYAGVPDQVFGVPTSAQLFSLLGVRPSLGRTLADADDLPKSANSAVISDRLWRRTFDADPRVIGRTITYSDEAFTIVGVMPPEFEFPLSQEEMWIPLRLNAGSTGALEMVARLKEGVTAAQAQSAMQIVARELEQRDPREKAGLRISVSPWRAGLDRNYELSAVLILVAVGLVLLIACANVSSLLLSRAVQRQRELAIRAALGAGFWRVARQLLAESFIVAVMGSLAGVAIGRVLLRLMLRQLDALPIALPHLQRVALNGRVLVFTAAVCLVLACIFAGTVGFRVAD
jgi:predicted permease